MDMRRRRLWPWAVVAAGAALAAPSAASAQIIEIGDLGTEVTPSCPSSPCLAVNRTTGYQAKVGPRRGLMKVPRDGRIVAWTIRLAKPGSPWAKRFYRRRPRARARSRLRAYRHDRRWAGQPQGSGLDRRQTRPRTDPRPGPVTGAVAVP